MANLTSEDLSTFEINRYDSQNILDTALKLNPNRYVETPDSYIFIIRGTPYEEERIKTSLIIESGYHLSYKRDIENIYDPYAIKIFYKERELGFVPREYSKSISTEIDINNVEYEIVVTDIKPIRDYKNIEVKMSIRR